MNDLHGEEETWPGMWILIYGSTTQYGGRTVPCVRVRADTTLTA